MHLKPLIYYVLCGVLLVVCRNACFGEVEVSLSSNVYAAKKLSDVLDVYVATDSGSTIGFKEAEIKLEHSIYGTVVSGYFALNRLDSFSGIIKPPDSVIISTAEIDSKFFLELMDKGALPAGRYYLHVRLSSDTDDYRTTQSFYIGKNDSAAKKKALFKPYLDVVSSTNYSYYSGAEPPNNARDAYVAVNGGVNILDIPFGINMLLTSDYKTVNFGYTPVFLELNTANMRQTLEDKFLKNIDRDKFKMQFSQERLKGLLKQKDELLMQLEALKKKLPEGATSIKNAWRGMPGDSLAKSYINKLDSLAAKDSALYKIQKRVLTGDSLANGFGERIKGFMGGRNSGLPDSLRTTDMHAVSGMADKIITDSFLLKRIAKLETNVADIDEKAEGLKKILASLDVSTLTKDYKDPGKIKNAISRSKYFKKAERLIYSIKNLKLGSFSVNGSRYFMSSTPFLGGSIELDWRSFYVRTQAGVIQGNGKFMDNLKHPHANVYVGGLGYHASDEQFIHVLIKRTVERDTLAEGTKQVFSKNYVLGYESAFHIKRYMVFKSEFFLSSYSSADFGNGIAKENSMLRGLFDQGNYNSEMGKGFATNNSLLFYLGKSVELKYTNNIIHPYYKNTGNFISAQNLNQHSAQVKLELVKNILRINSGFDYITQLIPEKSKNSIYRANGNVSLKLKGIIFNSLFNYSINSGVSKSAIFNINLTKNSNIKHLLITNIIYFSFNSINQYDTLKTMIGTIGHNFQIKYRKQWNYSNSLEFRWSNGMYDSKVFTWRGIVSFLPKPGIALSFQPNLMRDFKLSSRIGADVSINVNLVKNLELTLRCGYSRFDSFTDKRDFHQLASFISCNYKL
jgi:hypothetical protein